MFEQMTINRINKVSKQNKKIKFSYYFIFLSKLELFCFNFILSNNNEYINFLEGFSKIKNIY